MLRSTLVLLLAFPLSLAAQLPTLALPEQAVGEPRIEVIAGGSPSAIAAGESNFLIVSIASTHFNAFQHWAMLVDRDGAPLLDKSIPLAGDAATQAAAIAWSGHEYLVVLGSLTGLTSATRIDRSGRVLDPQPIIVHENDNFVGTAGRVAVWDGEQFVVASAARPLGTFVATRISESGEILQNDIPITDPQAYGLQAAGAHKKTVFVWNDRSGPHMRVMSADGGLSAIVQARGTAIVDVPDGFIAWSRVGDGLQLQHLDTNVAIDRPAILVPVPPGSNAGIQKSGDALLLLVRRTETAPLEAARITTRGEVLESLHEVLAPDQTRAFALVASNGVASVATWGEFPGNFYAPYITKAKQLDINAPANQVHRYFTVQNEPYVAFRGNDLAIAWNEEGLRSTIGRAPFRTSESTPVALASGPRSTLIAVSRDPLYSIPSQPLYAMVDGHDPALLDDKNVDGRFVRAVWTGKDFIVVWAAQDRTEIRGARIDANGHLVNGPTIIANTTTLDGLAIGASNSKTLVVYHDQFIVRGVLLDDVGATPIDDITTRDDNQNITSEFSVASDGTDFFVTWIDHGFNQANDWIAGRLIDANGHALTKLSGYSTGGNYKNTAATFWNGSNYIAIWSQQSHLYGVRVAKDGSLLDYPPVSLGTIDGSVSSYAEAPGGQIVVAYHRGGRAYTTTLVPGRQRAAAH